MDERRRKRSRRHGAAVCAALVFALSALLVPAGAVSAPDPGGETQLLVPVGKAIGVKLFAEGVLVVGLSENEGAVSPAKKGGMKAGDLILTMNDVTIGSTEHLQSLLAENGEREAAFGVRRGGRLVKLAVCPRKGQDGVCRLGAWIRDSMAGIGTVTFYDPQTGAFAALGHGITDVDTGKLMPLSRGSVMAASVKAVKRGASGSDARPRLALREHGVRHIRRFAGGEPAGGRLGGDPRRAAHGGPHRQGGHSGKLQGQRGVCL